MRVLAKTPCEIPDELRRAALFSALTGLRFSDISLLTWSNLRQSAELGDFLDFVIKKTGEPLVLPIAAEPREYLGEVGEPNEQIFPRLRYSVMTNVYLQRWAVAAGISRKITFHCFRRTFATAQITLGTDIYTVQQLLGHNDVRQTQIYVSLVDEKKREAANKMTLK